MEGAVVLLLLMFVVADCGSSKPITPPLSTGTYETSWLVVPVHPSPRYTDISDVTLVTYYDRVMQEVTTSLDGYGQPYTMYAGSPHFETGISADSLYEEVPESEREDDTDERRVHVDILQAIADEAGVQHLVVVDPNIEARVDGTGLGVGVGIPVGGGFSIGFSVPLVSIGTKTVRLTTATFWTVDPSDGNADEPSTPRPLWGGSRAADASAHQQISDDEDAVGYGIRSLILELKTGSTYNPAAFVISSDNPVIVYRRDQPRLRGTSFHVDGTNVVLSTEDGSTQTVPLHTVSSIRSTFENRKIF